MGYFKTEIIVILVTALIGTVELSQIDNLIEVYDKIEIFKNKSKERVKQFELEPFPYIKQVSQFNFKFLTEKFIISE